MDIKMDKYENKGEEFVKYISTCTCKISEWLLHVVDVTIVVHVSSQDSLVLTVFGLQFSIR